VRFEYELFTLINELRVAALQFVSTVCIDYTTISQQSQKKAKHQKSVATEEPKASEGERKKIKSQLQTRSTGGN